MSEREAANDRLRLYMTAVGCLVVEQVQARGCGAQSIAQIQWTSDQKSPPAQQPCVPNAKGSKISFCKDCRVLHDRRYMSGATQSCLMSTRQGQCTARNGGNDGEMTDVVQACTLHAQTVWINRRKSRDKCTVPAQLPPTRRSS